MPLWGGIVSEILLILMFFGRVMGDRVAILIWKKKIVGKLLVFFKIHLFRSENSFFIWLIIK